MTTLLPAHLEALLSDAPVAPEWSDAELDAYAADCEARGLCEGPFAPPVSPVLGAGLFDRTFNAARRDQGFADQGHLDRFYAYFDHTKACAACAKPGWMWNEGDASWQPTMGKCSTASSLLANVSR